MGADQHHDWRAAAASALEWWSDAGVDTLVQEGPRDWLARPAPPAPRVEAVVTAPTALPDSLDAFIAWRSGPAAPEAGWGSPLFVASGTPGAAIMVAIDCANADGLLTGRPGALFDRMLAAIGHSRASIYLAPLAAAEPLSGRLLPEVRTVLAPLLVHHVALAAPRRLLVMGEAATRAIHGSTGQPQRAALQRINLNGATTEVVFGLTPKMLIERPVNKAESWKGLQMLVGGLG